MTKSTKQIVSNSGILLTVILFALVVFSIKTTDQLAKLRETYHAVKVAELKDQQNVIDARLAEVQVRNEAAELERKLAEVSGKYDYLTHLLTDAPVDKKKVYKLTITAYTASVRECGKSDGITATLEHVQPGISAAVSRDLKHLLGKHVYIVGVGRRYVNDLMAEDIRNSIDLNMKYVNNAIKFGKEQHRVLVLD